MVGYWNRGMGKKKRRESELRVLSECCSENGTTSTASSTAN